MRVYCKKCENVLTNKLELFAGIVNIDIDFDIPLIKEGFYQTRNEIFKDGIDQIIINENDLINYKDHWDRMRLIGCCGPSGYDGPNKICGNCGSEIATLSNDCITHYFVAFEMQNIKVKESSLT